MPALADRVEAPAPPWRMAAVLGALAAAYLAWVASIPLNHDTQWYLLSVARWLDGAVMYRDILELNPPLAAVLTAPAVAFARATGVDVAPTFVAYVAALAAGSLGLTAAVLRRRDDLAVPRRRAFLAIAAAALLVYPLASFGQREQIALILVLPYLVLAGGGRPMSSRAAVLIGALAGLGFSIKPYFLLVPLLIAIVDIGRERRVGAAFTPAHWGIALAAGLYALAVVCLFPHYLGEMVPLARLTYAAGWDQPFARLLRQPELWLVPLAIVAKRRAGAGEATDRTSLVLLLAAIGFAGAYLWQHKGWFYHVIPLGGVLTLLAGWWVVRAPAGADEAKRAGAAALALLGVLTLARGPYDDLASRQLVAALSDASGARIHALTSSMRVTSPVASALGGRWCSRFPTLWPLAGAQAKLADPMVRAEAQAALARTRSLVVEEFATCRPTVVIVERPRPRRFRYLDFMRADPRFAAHWSGYRRTDIVGGFEIWRRWDRGGDHAGER